MGTVLERARAHFQAMHDTTVEVPEWGDALGPLVVKVRPMTLADRKLYAAKHGEDRSGVDAAITVVIRHATDAATGEPLFTEADRATLKKEVAPGVLARIAEAAMGKPLDALVEDAEGN